MALIILLLCPGRSRLLLQFFLFLNRFLSDNPPACPSATLNTDLCAQQRRPAAYFPTTVMGP
uniref:Secreted protein n=1 Tax=Anguilla anguilla TaxID=7936 RepID=A0A0E9VVA3_ANGAN